MNLDTVKNNAAVLFNNADAILNVDNSGNLSIISNWNLIGRLVKFLKNLDGSVTEKINNAALKTLDMIAMINRSSSNGGCIYINGGYSAPIYPANYLGREMLKDQWGQVEGIRVLADELLRQKDLYRDNPNQRSYQGDQKVFLANEFDEMPPYVIVC
jgi:hypothetical protein